MLARITEFNTYSTNVMSWRTCFGPWLK
jgi:hypothetical protein